MITKHTIYVLTCDKCGRTFSQNEDDGYMTWFYSRKEVLSEAISEGWSFATKRGDYAYCPECLEKKQC